MVTTASVAPVSVTLPSTTGQARSSAHSSDAPSSVTFTYYAYGPFPVYNQVRATDRYCFSGTYPFTTDPGKPAPRDNDLAAGHAMTPGTLCSARDVAAVQAAAHSGHATHQPGLASACGPQARPDVAGQLQPGAGLTWKATQCHSLHHYIRRQTRLKAQLAQLRVCGGLEASLLSALHLLALI